MGWFSSNTPAPTAPVIAAPQKSALEKVAFVDLEKAEQREAELASQVEATRQEAAVQLGALGTQLAAVTTWKTWLKYGAIFLGLVIVVFVVIYLYDYFAIQRGWQTILLPSPPQAAPPPPQKAAGPGVTAPVTAPPAVQSAQPPLYSKLLNLVTGSTSSGDLAPSLHDATTSMTIPATSAPLSNQTQGSYGVQWWMFVKDWNYGYGKDKSVLTRADPTNAAVMNPSISLHPTDNTLKVSISLFPSGEGGSKATPAASGGSTDDVFVCEVPNIPLQSWFSVSATVFSRNVDIYIDGKLVKSCLLPGVPKPAVGDINVAKDGGFSGYVCNVYHYPRMLTPADAMTFFSAGTKCQNQVSSSGTTAPLTGYSVKFGVYDTLGKQIQNYTF